MKKQIIPELGISWSELEFQSRLIAGGIFDDDPSPIRARDKNGRFRKLYHYEKEMLKNRL